MDYLDELINEYERLQYIDDILGLDEYTKIRMKHLGDRIENLQKVRYREVKYNITTNV